LGNSWKSAGPANPWDRGREAGGKGVGKEKTGDSHWPNYLERGRVAKGRGGRTYKGRREGGAVDAGGDIKECEKRKKKHKRRATWSEIFRWRGNKREL